MYSAIRSIASCHSLSDLFTTVKQKERKETPSERERKGLRARSRREEGEKEGEEEEWKGKKKMDQGKDRHLRENQLWVLSFLGKDLRMLKDWKRGEKEKKEKKGIERSRCIS